MALPLPYPLLNMFKKLEMEQESRALDTLH